MINFWICRVAVSRRVESPSPTTKLRTIAEEENFVGYSEISSAIVIAEEISVGYTVVEIGLSAIL